MQVRPEHRVMAHHYVCFWQSWQCLLRVHFVLNNSNTILKISFQQKSVLRITALIVITEFEYRKQRKAS